MTRLLLLPIRRGMLHVVEVLSGLGDFWLLLVGSVTLMLAVGLLVSGSIMAGLLGLLAALGLVSTLALIAASISLVTALVFRRRARAEWFTLAAMMLFTVSMVFLATLDEDYGRRGDAERPRTESAELDRPVQERFDRALPAWTRWLPSELYTRSLIGAVEVRADAVVAPLLFLLIWAASLFVLSRKIFFRLLETPETGGTRAGTRRDPLRLRGLPGLGPGASAVALAHVRLAVRTVRGKLAIFLNFLLLGTMYGVIIRPQLALQLPEDSGLGMGMLLTLAGFLLSLLSLQPLLFNQFAIDRAGLTLQFLAPVSAADLALGKLVAGGMLAALATLLCFLTALALEPGGDPLLWASLLPAGLSIYLALAPLATLLSAVFPKTSDLSRLGKQGNPHGVAGLAGTLLTALAAAPALLLGVVGVFVIESPGVTLLMLCGWAALALWIAAALLRPAVAAVERRRETLLLVANGR